MQVQSCPQGASLPCDPTQLSTQPFCIAIKDLSSVLALLGWLTPADSRELALPSAGCFAEGVPQELTAPSAMIVQKW